MPPPRIVSAAMAPPPAASPGAEGPGRRRPRSSSPWSLAATLLLALLLVLLLMPTPAAADACASYTDCLSCSNSSMTCHWCGNDNACHTIGSPYGCLTGVNCYSNQACVRSEPEPMPHKAPSGSVLIGLGVFLLSALFCTGACFFVANEYVHHATSIRMEKDPNYQELVAFEGEEAGQGTEGGQASLSSSSSSAEYRLLSGNDPGSGGVAGGGGAAEEGGWGNWDPIPRIRVVERSRFVTVLYYVIRAALCLTLAWLALVALGVLLYTPHAPDVSVCNQELDWGSIISGLEKLKLEADYQLLLSIYNPNRLDVAITSGQGVFKHDHEPIGHVEFPHFTIKGGAITDVLVTLVFTPSVWKSLQLDIAFQTGSLMVMVDISVAGKVIWNGMQFFPFAYAMNNYFIHVGDDATGSRALCNCTSW